MKSIELRVSSRGILFNLFRIHRYARASEILTLTFVLCVYLPLYPGFECTILDHSPPLCPFESIWKNVFRNDSKKGRQVGAPNIYIYYIESRREEGSRSLEVSLVPVVDRSWRAKLTNLGSSTLRAPREERSTALSWLRRTATLPRHSHKHL